MKKNILITGSTGFIGSNIVNQLLKKNIHVYDVLREKNKNNKIIHKLNSKRNYHPIFYKKLNELENKIKNIKIDTVINCATYYSNKNDLKVIQNLIQTNIIFCSVILEIVKNKIKKFINFGSMMEYSDKRDFSPQNFYAITKYSFQKIEEFYKSYNKQIKFYDLKLYETYGSNDKRKKIIPTIINNYLKNKYIKIISRNLKMNFVHVESLTNAVNMIIFKNIKEGEYCMKNNKTTKIKVLIDSLNKKLKKKIKVKYLSDNKSSISNKKFKKFPNWIDKIDLEEFLLRKLL